MNAAPDFPTLFARPQALRFGLAVFVGLSLVVFHVTLDNSVRRSLETVSEITAVGDTAYFQLAKVVKLPVVGVMLRGEPLYVVSAETIEVRDTHTLLVERDAVRDLRIYQLSAAGTDEERDRAEKGRKAYLLKTAPNQYVKAQVAAP